MTDMRVCSDFTPATISIIGLGRLGAPMAASIASRGYQVIGVDADPDKVERINGGLAPVYEPGLQDLLLEVRGRVWATTDINLAVRESDATFILVPTPSDEDGAFSDHYVRQVCEHVGAALREHHSYHVVIVTSTVMPGTTERVVLSLLEARSGKTCGVDFGLCYSPEFVALGSVIKDFLNPDFVLIGESDPQSGDWLETFYLNVCAKVPAVARMNFINAEIAKIAVNTFVTTKITFANMLARICEKADGANVDAVTSALGLDSRIGPKYLTGATGYGGPCFPRDNIALSAFARSVGTTAGLAVTTDAENRKEVGRLVDVIVSRLPPFGTVGILGLAYKPGTDVVEESPGLLLAEFLARRRISVISYDPLAMERARAVTGSRVSYAASMVECVRASDIVVIPTPWPEFRDFTRAAVDRGGRSLVIIDCWRLLDSSLLDHSVTVIPVGCGDCRYRSHLQSI